MGMGIRVTGTLHTAEGGAHVVFSLCAQPHGQAVRGSRLYTLSPVGQSGGNRRKALGDFKLGKSEGLGLGEVSLAASVLGLWSGICTGSPLPAVGWRPVSGT